MNEIETEEKYRYNRYDYANRLFRIAQGISSFPAYSSAKNFTDEIEKREKEIIKDAIEKLVKGLKE